MNELGKVRLGNWLPKKDELIEIWIKNLKVKVFKENKPLIKPIAEFKQMVENNPVLNGLASSMFTEAKLARQKTPLGTPELKDFNEFLLLLNGIMRQAPQFTECPDNEGSLSPCGLIGFPINALLDWPMATSFGNEFFANSLVNQQFKKILEYWSEFLVSKDSRYVLVEDDLNATPLVYGWLSNRAKEAMIEVACNAVGQTKHGVTFEDIFICEPSEEYEGFQSWDDFFTRRFKAGVRPIAQGDDIIVNACESAPLQVSYKVPENAEFWLKEQAYSLENMMNFDPLAKLFIGGTIYQAFLSALSYHRWNAPVSGTIKKTFIVNGTYFLENQYQGFTNSDGADPSAPNDSQQFLSAVATRAVIFIEADNPKIGLMCFIAIGMAEVSSCEITVNEGEHIEKGNELGMFHFGGSTHCLVFRPEVELEFDFHGLTPSIENTTNIPVCSKIAKVL